MTDSCLLTNNSSSSFQTRLIDSPDSGMCDDENYILPGSSTHLENMRKSPKYSMVDDETCILPNSSILFQDLLRKLPKSNKSDNCQLPTSSTQVQEKKRKRTKHQTWQRNSTYGNFKPYLVKVKKLLLPKSEFSDLVLQELDDFISHVIEMFDAELTRLSRINRGKTLSQKQLEAAVRLSLPGNIGDLATKFGNCAVRAYYDEFIALGGGVYRQGDIIFDADKLTEGSDGSSMQFDFAGIEFEEKSFANRSETGSH